MPISEKQMQILAFPYTNYQAVIMDGAVRTGKTSLGFLSFVDWAMSNFNRTNFIVGAKTVGSARKNIIEPFLSLNYARRKYSMKYCVDGNKLVVRQGKKINTFGVYGGKDTTSYQLVQGYTAAGVFLDEVPLLDREFVNQCLSRCISFENKKYWFTMNADNPGCWFYKQWILDLDKHNAMRIHFELKDNPALSEKQIRDTANDYAGVFYDRYIRGLWVAGEGSIYHTFSSKKQQLITNVPQFDIINMGIDFGGNKSNHAFVATGITSDYQLLTALASESMPANSVTPTEMNQAIVNFCEKVKHKYGYINAIYADSAEQTLINGLRTSIDIPVSNSLKRPIKDRIRATTSLVAQDRFYYTEDCQSLVDALTKSVYDSKKFDDVRLDNGTNDQDIIDAFEYSFERYIPRFMKREKYDNWDDDN